MLLIKKCMNLKSHGRWLSVVIFFFKARKLLVSLCYLMTIEFWFRELGVCPMLHHNLYLICKHSCSITKWPLNWSQKLSDYRKITRSFWLLSIFSKLVPNKLSQKLSMFSSCIYTTWVMFCQFCKELQFEKRALSPFKMTCNFFTVLKSCRSSQYSLSLTW